MLAQGHRPLFFFAPRAIALVLFTAVLLTWAQTANAVEGAAVPDGLVPLASEEGQRLLVESRARADYFALASHFETQKTQGHCAMASVVTALNALPIPAPEVPEWAPYRAFTQDNIFNERSKAAGVARPGLTLEQVAALVEAQPATAEAHHAGDGGTSLDDFRRALVADLAHADGFVLVNFLRSTLGEEPNGPVEASLAGHWSPVAAYHEGSDRVLMLDVARYKYPPVWIPLPALFAAMNTVDTDSGKTRGFLLVHAAPGTRVPGPVTRSHSRLLTVLVVAPLVFFLLGALTGSWWRGRRMRKNAKAAAA